MRISSPTPAENAPHGWAWTAHPEGGPVYHGLAYQSLFADYDQCAARCVRWTGAGGVLDLPILVRDLGRDSREAYSAYGYGGLLGSAQLSYEDLASLRIFLAREGILALFLRHAPFLGNQDLLPADMRDLNRWTYKVHLPQEPDFDLYVAGLPQKLRWSVNYARRAELVVTFSPCSRIEDWRIADFYRLYADLMIEKETTSYYLFSETFFQAHAERLGEGCELAEIRDSGTGDLLGGALFLSDGTGWAHYHLSAARREAMKLQAMEYLLTAAIHRYGQKGLHWLHLGGGHDLNETDGLSRFKMKFSDQKLSFCTTKLICDDTRYTTERSRLPLSHPRFFLIGDARGSK